MDTNKQEQTVWERAAMADERDQARRYGDYDFDPETDYSLDRFIPEWDRK